MSAPTQEINYKVEGHELYALAKKIHGHYGAKICYCLETGKFFFYTTGYWQEIHPIELRAKLAIDFPQINNLGIYQRDQVLDNIKQINFKRLKDFNWNSLFNCRNTMFNPYDGERIEHDPMFYSTYQLDFDYTQGEESPLWLKAIDEIFQGNKEKINTLQEFFGYCLVPEVNYKKALLLMGDSDSGKSTVLNVLRSMIGEKNCSSVPLKHLSNPQYTPLLINKLVNIDADVDKNASQYEAEFKIITSGEPVTCNQKHIPTFDFTPYARIVLAANEFPKITDHSSAFYKRLILIPCDRIFEAHEQDVHLAQKIRGQLNGVINWAMQGLRRLKERGKFEKYTYMTEAVQDLEDDNNPVNEFITENIETCMDSSLEKGVLYDRYTNWARQTNNYTLSKAKFAGVVFKKFHTFTPKDARDTVSGKRVWRNLKLIKFI